MNTTNQWEIIKSLRTYFDQEITYRFNCPFCNGKNTLNVTKIRNEYVWNCYRSSCTTKGRKTTDFSIKDLNSIGTVKKTEPEQFVIPDSFISPIWHTEAVEYLNRMHCTSAWQGGAVRVYYDPPRDRVVFIITDKAGTVINANGRSLNRDPAVPKWLRYGKSDLPFVCHRGMDIAVVVEDIPSACAVYPDFTGVSLLGTNLTLAAANELKEYKKVLVCLDPDAQSKAIAMRNKLAYICDDVSTVFIPNDLKYFNQEQIKDILNT